MSIIICLILSLPLLGDGYTFVDLIKYFVATLLLIETGFHVLQALAQLVVVELELLHLLTIG